MRPLERLLVMGAEQTSMRPPTLGNLNTVRRSSYLRRASDLGSIGTSASSAYTQRILIAQAVLAIIQLLAGSALDWQNQSPIRLLQHAGVRGLE